MKRLVSLALCLILTISCLAGLTITVAGANLLEGKVTWAPSSSMLSVDDLAHLTDGDSESTLTYPNKQAAKAMQYFFDLGTTPIQYNKIKVSFKSYNAMKISVYSATSLTYQGSPSGPPAATGASTIKFANYDTPIVNVNYNPYRITTAGGTAYSTSELLTFNAKSDRYVCVEVTTAYDSTTGSYTGINNVISEIELGYGVPSSVAVTSPSDSIPVPSALAGSKTVSFIADVLDTDGVMVTDTAFAGKTFSLASAKPGVSINASTGALTITSAATEGDVTVVATCTASGYESISGSKTVSITSVDPTETELAQAASDLTFNLLSPQKITAVGKNLTLPAASGGSLVLGTKTYSGMSIAWRTSNSSVISAGGVVTRPAGANANVTLTATLTKNNRDGIPATSEKSFSITVIKAGDLVDMQNIMKGGYGWTTGGWGTATLAVDGDRTGTSRWTLGNHSHGTINAGFRVGSGNLEKYNKIVIYFFDPQKMENYIVTGYDSISSADPGAAASADFKPGGIGAKVVAAYDASNPATIPDVTDKKVVIKLPQTVQSKYFGISLTNGSNKDDNSCGIYEFEVYYTAPNDAVLTDSSTKFYAPPTTGTASFDIPQFTVYDELGEVLTIPFEHSVTIAGSQPGITMSDGKINIAGGTAATSVNLTYKSWDADRVWLEKTISVPLKVYTQEYYDAAGVADYLGTIIPEKTLSDITLPASYNGAAIAWTSSNASNLTDAGSVIRPALTEGDKTAALTAVITKGEYKITKTFNVLIIKQMTDEQLLIQDANHIDLGIKDAVSSDITLPSVGYYGSDIKWTSDKPSAIDGDGTYHKIKAPNSILAVTLTAHLTYNGVSETKDFVLYAVTTPEKSGGGGGGSGGGGVTLYPIEGTFTPPIPITPIEAAQGSFADVPSTHWAKSYIEKLAAKKIVSGTSGGDFEPDRTITREEFIKMIVSAFGYTLKPGETAFADVQKDAWYADYVVTAYKEGIISGTSGNSFGIGQNITREDMAVIMERVLESRKVSFVGNAKSFTDAASISEYAAAAVGNLTMLGVLSGDDAGGFAPRKNATRAEAAKVLTTAMEKGGIK